MALRPGPGSGSGGSPAELMRSAVRLYETGDFERARKTARKLLAAAPVHPDVTHLLGAISLAQGRFREAIEDFNRSLKANPRQAPVHNNMGEAYRRLGDHERAVASYDAAIRLDGRNAGYRNNLGVALRDAGKPEEALAALDEALKLDPANQPALINRATVLHVLGRSDEAVTLYRDLLARSPRNTEALNNLGSTLNDMGHFEEAVEHFRKVIAINPRHVAAHCNSAVALRKLGHANDAIRHYELAKAIDPADFTIARQLGNLLRELGRTAGAITNLAEAVDRDPSNTTTRRQLASAYLAAGDKTKARQTYEAVLARDPHSTACYRLIAEIGSDELSEQSIAAMEALYRSPDTLDDERRMHLAFALGKVREEAKSYSEALDFFIEGNRLQRARQTFDHATSLAEFQEIADVFTTAFFDRLRVDRIGHPDPSPIFILGMPRSGTTLVEQIISSHTDVYGAGELHDLHDMSDIEGHRASKAYPDWLGHIENTRFGELGAEYIRRVRENVGASARFTDKMPHNFRFVGLIRAILPNARVIHCIRDPADNCLSIFKNFFTDGHGYATGLGNLGEYHRAYQGLMAHWRQELSGFMHEVRYEEMVADQEGESRRLLDFCGLAWEDRVLDFHETERMVNTISVSQVRRPIYTSSVKLSERYGERLRPLLERLYARS